MSPRDAVTQDLCVAKARPPCFCVASTRLQSWHLPCARCRRFRVVRARQFLQSFASDRQHMWVDAPTMSGERGAWVAPPPAWPPIIAPGKPRSHPHRAPAVRLAPCQGGGQVHGLTSSVHCRRPSRHAAALFGHDPGCLSQHRRARGGLRAGRGRLRQAVLPGASSARGFGASCCVSGVQCGACVCACTACMSGIVRGLFVCGCLCLCICVVCFCCVCVHMCAHVRVCGRWVCDCRCYEICCYDICT